MNKVPDSEVSCFIAAFEAGGHLATYTILFVSASNQNPYGSGLQVRTHYP